MAAGQARAYAEFHMKATHASTASNGASARIGILGIAHRDFRPTQFYWTPTGADATGSSGVTYRQMVIYNGGTSGTGTQVLASLNLVASLASWGTRAFSAVTSATVLKDSVIYGVQTTVGSGDHANCVMVAGEVHGVLEFIG